MNRQFVRNLCVAAIVLLAAIGDAFALAVPKPTVKNYTTHVKITWPKIKGAYCYYVYRGTSKSLGKAKLIAVASAKKRIAYDIAGTPGVTQYYWVGAVQKPSSKTKWRYKVWRNAKLCAKGYKKLTAPTPTATGIKKKALYPTLCIQVTWPAVAGAVKYTIKRSETKDYSKAKTIQSNTIRRVFDDLNVTPGKTYWYWILPIGKNGSSVYAKSKCAGGKRWLEVPQPKGYYWGMEDGNASSYPVVLYWDEVFCAKKYYLFTFYLSSYDFSLNNVWGTTEAGYHSYTSKGTFSPAVPHRFYVCPVDEEGDWYYDSEKYVMP